MFFNVVSLFINKEVEMSKESAKNFLLNSDVSSEINSIVEKTIIDKNKHREKLNMIVDEASKYGYNFTIDELKRALEEISSMSRGDLSHVAGGGLLGADVGVIKEYLDI